MNQISDKLQELSLEEKVDLFIKLQTDDELKAYLAEQEFVQDELAKRDTALKNGHIHLITANDISERLKNRRNAI